MDPAALDALPLFAPAGRLAPDALVTARWAGGHQGAVTVANQGDAAADGWSLRLFLPEGWTVSARAGVRVIEARGGISFDLAVARRTVDADRVAPPPEPIAAPAGTVAPRWMGFNIGSWWRGSFGSGGSIRALADLAGAGANAVAIVPTRYVADLAASEIFETRQSEPDANVIAMMRAARDQGLAVILKPHVDPVDFSMRHRLQPVDPDRFFASYGAMMVHYARMAQAEGAALFVVGTELVGLTEPRHEARWRALIAAVRAVYDGPLTYAANYGEDLRVPFWDALDYIGVDMYAPLVEVADPSLDQVVAAWLEPPRHSFTDEVYDGQPLVEAMARLSARHGRPILFTEIGYRSIDGAGTAEAMTRDDGGPADPEEQAVFYEGFARAMTAAGADWLAGVLFWDWSVEPAMPGRPVPDPHGFSVAGKPAAGVFRDHLAPLARSTPAGHEAGRARGEDDRP